MEKFYDNIERYLLGELSGQALNDFETALQSDTVLAQSVAQHREMMQRLDALRLRNKVKSAAPAHLAETVPFYANRSVWVIAILLALLAAASWFFYQPPSPALKMEPSTSPTPIQPPPSPPARDTTPVKEDKKQDQLIAMARAFHEQPAQSFVRDATQKDNASTSKGPVQLAADAYKNKNYRLTLEHLRLMVISEQDEEARYLRANARFQLGKFAEAALDFKELESSFQFKHEARWNFMLCQVALGKIAEAKSLLAKMVADKDFPFHAKALEFKRKTGL